MKCKPSKTRFGEIDHCWDGSEGLIHNAPCYCGKVVLDLTKNRVSFLETRIAELEAEREIYRKALENISTIHHAKGLEVARNHAKMVLEKIDE